jgi:glutamyl-tRNA(Gln) amidotransferase subunit E
MSEFNIKNIGLKVGLEIHQQLDTKKKLFCDCIPKEEEEFTRKFSRRLRASKSELGKIDPAALLRVLNQRLSYIMQIQIVVV